MNKSRVVLLALFSIGMLVCVGCRTPHLRDRLDDSARIFRLNVGAGPGFLVNAHVSRAVALGFGAYESRRFGFRNGHGWVWDERRYDANLLVPIWGWEDVETTYQGSMPVSHLYGDEKNPHEPGKEYRWPVHPAATLQNSNRGWGEISVNVHLIWLGVDAGVDFGQFIDYIVGWFGLDLMGDDSRTGAEVVPHDPDQRRAPGRSIIGP